MNAKKQIIFQVTKKCNNKCAIYVYEGKNLKSKNLYENLFPSLFLLLAYLQLFTAFASGCAKSLNISFQQNT